MVEGEEAAMHAQYSVGNGQKAVPSMLCKYHITVLVHVKASDCHASKSERLFELN